MMAFVLDNWARRPYPRVGSQTPLVNRWPDNRTSQSSASILNDDSVRRQQSSTPGLGKANFVSKLRDLDCVRLLGELTTAQGIIPVGEVGTIVHHYPRGEAFEVEFDTPFSAVITLRPEEIEGLNV